MSNIQAITRERHADLYWKRHANYTFAAKDAVSALVAQELPKAMLCFPIALFASDGAFLPVAVQSLQPGQNLFVAPDGRWIGTYVPSAYRCYPFVLANAADGQHVLCVDEDSGLLSSTEGDLLLDKEGQPSQSVAEILNVLSQIAGNRQTTQRICAVLQQHNLIQPWPIKLQTEAGAQNLTGLFCIDEAAMNQLPAEAFITLRDTGALAVAYCQLLSMQHMPMLGKLADAHAKAVQPVAEKLEFLNAGETISFGAMR